MLENDLKICRELVDRIYLKGWSNFADFVEDVIRNFNDDYFRVSYENYEFFASIIDGQYYKFEENRRKFETE